MRERRFAAAVVAGLVLAAVAAATPLRGWMAPAALHALCSTDTDCEERFGPDPTVAEWLPWLDQPDLEA